MEILIDEVCGHIHNYFTIRDAVHEGSFTVSNGGITVDFLQDGQYYRVVGSVFNDGVWKYPAEDMQAETFTGAVIPLAIPAAFLALVEEIEAWQTQYGESLVSPMTSESFNNYSYTKATGTASDGSYAALGWNNVFSKRLDRWRKLP